MKRFLVLLFFAHSVAHGILTEPDKQAIAFVNMLTNGGFESGKASWTAASNTFTTSTSNFSAGKSSGLMTMSAQTGTLTSTVTPAAAGPQTSGMNMEASCNVMTTQTTIQVCAMSGGTETNCVSVPSTGTWQQVPTNFIGPANGTSVGVRVKATGSTTGTVNVDECYVGRARNIGTVAQAQMFGTIVWPLDGTCGWSTSSGSMTSFSANSSCTFPTGTNLAGQAQAPATKIPGITFASLPAGEYLVVVTGSFGKSTATNSALTRWRLTDGTNFSGQQEIFVSGSTNFAFPNIQGRFAYTTPQSNVTFQIQGMVNNAAETAKIEMSQGDLSIQVYYFPSTSQQAVSVNGGPSMTDWTSYVPTFVGLGTVNPTSVFWRRVGDTLEVQGTFTTGTVTSSVVSISLPSGLTVSSLKFPSTASLIGTYTRGVTNLANPMYSVFTTQGATTVNVGLLEAAAVSRGPLVAETGTGAFGNTEPITIEFKVAIQGWSAPSANIPILVGSVSSNSLGAERIERVNFSSTGTISSQSGSWVSSITANATGDSTINIAAGIFSAAPSCTFSGETGDANGYVINLYNAVTPSATAQRVYCQRRSDGAATNCSIKAICMGPR